MSDAPQKFYRYEAVEYASMGIDGEYERSRIPNPKIELRTYNLFKETPKGYWIGYGFLYQGLRSIGKWVPKEAKKRYAYPTKQEAMVNFIKRNEYRIRILKHQLWACEMAVSTAKNMKIED
jgi:hypothetical protein